MVSTEYRCRRCGSHEFQGVLRFTLNGGNGTNSGLETTDGKDIYLFKEGDLIVGRYDGPDFSDRARPTPGATWRRLRSRSIRSPARFR